MAELDYRVWYRGGLWFWDVYGSATTPVAQGAALSSVAARAEAMAYAMRASESNGSIESCRLTKETARQALMDARDRYNGLKQRIPNLRTSRIIRSTRAMIEESCRLLGHRQSHATLRKELEEAEQALLLSRVHVAHQLAVIDKLERDNLDASEAQLLLENFIDSQLEIEAHVDGLGSKLNDFRVVDQ